VSSRREEWGVEGFDRDAEGELKVNRRLREGVLGAVVVLAPAVAEPDRCGDEGGSGGVTSDCRIEVNIAFACSK